MPKGRKATNANKPAEPLVPIGAKFYSPVAGAEPEPLPPGIAVRSRKSIQVEFMFEGMRCTEQVPHPPTPTGIRAAVEYRNAVITAIRLGKFRYEDYFPNAKRVKAAVAADRSREPQRRSEPTVGDLLAEFLPLYRREHGEGTTADTHEEVIRSRLAPALGRLPISELTYECIVNYRDVLRTTGGRDGDGLTDARISNILTPLRSVAKMAVRAGYLKRNPFDSIAPTKSKKGRGIALDGEGNPSFDEPLPMDTDPDIEKAARAADPFDEQEREAILRQLTGQVRRLYLFAFWTGLRTGELIAFRWCDVDWANSRVIVRLSYSKNRFTDTKSHRKRWVPLLPPALEALRQQFLHTGAKGTWVFNNPVTQDRWQNSTRLLKRWIRALKAAGVRYRSQYQTRHTYASILMSAGESAPYVAETMGHLDHRLVALVYARFVAQRDMAPGERTVQLHQAEWTRLACLFEDDKDFVTPADRADELEGDAVDSEEDDPMDALGDLTGS